MLAISTKPKPLLRPVSRSVITGFVNALAILILLAQLPELIGVPWLTYVMVAAGLGIIYLFPLATKSIPSPLVCIIVLTAIAITFFRWVSEEERADAATLGAGAR